jgi:hypothetical protein
MVLDCSAANIQLELDAVATLLSDGNCICDNESSGSSKSRSSSSSDKTAAGGWAGCEQQAAGAAICWTVLLQRSFTGTLPPIGDCFFNYCAAEALCADESSSGQYTSKQHTRAHLSTGLQPTHVAHSCSSNSASNPGFPAVQPARGAAPPCSLTQAADILMKHAIAQQPN